MDGLGEADHAAEVQALAGAMGREAMDRAERAATVWRMLQVHARKDAISVAAACDDALSILRDKLPEPVFAGAAPYFTSQREECAMWAEFASDGQIAAMLAVCLDRIGGTRLLLDDRKRLLVAVWNSLTPDDRKAFRDRVMPKDSAR